MQYMPGTTRHARGLMYPKYQAQQPIPRGVHETWHSAFHILISKDDLPVIHRGDTGE